MVRWEVISPVGILMMYSQQEVSGVAAVFAAIFHIPAVCESTTVNPIGMEWAYPFSVSHGYRTASAAIVEARLAPTSSRFLSIYRLTAFVAWYSFSFTSTAVGASKASAPLFSPIRDVFIGFLEWGITLAASDRGHLHATMVA